MRTLARLGRRDGGAALAIVLGACAWASGSRAFAEGPECPRPGSDAVGAPTAEGRALAFLAREVPRWSAENKCYSCHNNGDAARALYTAARLGDPVPPEALADTSAWLARPEGWDHNGGEGPFSDKRLARIQFAAALATAVESGRVDDRRALVQAARRLADDQSDDGSWAVDEAETIGSPATLGRPLATYLMRKVLHDADATLFRAQVEKADRWLGRLRISSVLDAATVLLSSGPDDRPEADARRRAALDYLRRSQSGEGGWGPYPNTPAEPFDTAVALLALARLDDRADVSPMIRRGRASLLATQAPDGSWPETTRPTGFESYAQRLSTSGWATLALLATRGKAGSR